MSLSTVLKPEQTEEKYVSSASDDSVFDINELNRAIGGSLCFDDNEGTVVSYEFVKNYLIDLTEDDMLEP